MERTESCWIFLGIAILFLMMVHPYVISVKTSESFSTKKKKPKTPPKQETQNMIQAPQLTRPAIQYNQYQPPNGYPQNAPTMRYENMDNLVYDQLQMSQPIEPQMSQPMTQPMGPPPPIETHPRKDYDEPQQVPQGVMATQPEPHPESMGSDNFFSGGGLSPANGSEFGSPF